MKRINLLHFAPEPCLVGFLGTYQNVDYLSVDVNEGAAMQKEDITKLSFRDASFDAIVCSHVLEHVVDDERAMAELFRVLAEGGFAIIDVPIDWNREHTNEDPNITSPEERTRAFWQHNHVRLYARDFPDKLRRAGFDVTADTFIGWLGKWKRKHFGLENVPLFRCTKRASP